MARINRDHIDKFFEYNLDLDTKVLYLGYGNDSSEEDIDAECAANTIRALHILSKYKPDQPIRIIMNCSGGDVVEGMAIYDAVRLSPCIVQIDVIGKCYSMASWILQAADIRRISANSAMMIHDGEGGWTGKSDEVRNWNKYHRELMQRMDDLMLARIRERHPNYPRSKLKKMLATDTILWPEQALELGLVDEIISEPGE